MEKKMETTIMGYRGTAIRIRFLDSQLIKGKPRTHGHLSGCTPRFLPGCPN